MGRTMIGYEVQKTFAAVDWFEDQTKREAVSNTAAMRRRPIGVIGHGEGGLIALYAAAADTRIDAALVCGYFQAREGLWRETHYWNMFGPLREIGGGGSGNPVAPPPPGIQASP